MLTEDVDNKYKLCKSKVIFTFLLKKYVSCNALMIDIKDLA